MGSAAPAAAPAAPAPSLPAQVASAISAAPPEFTAFHQWVEQQLAGKSVSLPQGEALAYRRREVMLQLIQEDPERALALAVPFRWRQTLPGRITRHFEEQVDGHGELAVLAATDFETRQTTITRTATVGGRTFDAFVYGWRQGAPTRADVPLHGIALAGKFAVSASPLRVLDADEAKARATATAGKGGTDDAICGVSGRPATWQNQQVTADLDGTTVHLCSAQHLNLVEQRWLMASGGAGFVAGANPHITETWTHGPKSVLVMRVNFPDDLTEPISEGAAYTMMDGADKFYVAGSYGATSLTPTVTPLVTVAQTKGWYAVAGPAALLKDAREAARRAGFNTTNYARDIVCLTRVPGFNWAGLAYVEAKGAWLQGFSAGVASHELGHNWGLFHANAWNTTNGSVTGPGTHEEYGNIYDTMGTAAAGNWQFNAMHKNLLGWLPDGAVRHITTNGLYRLFPFDTARRTNGSYYAAQLARDYQRDCWLEVRHSFLNNRWLQNGVLLGWSPWADSVGGTHLLDTTPGSPADSASKDDAALTIGRTFSDPIGVFHVTPVARATGTTNEWLDMQVNFGAFPGNHAPQLAVEADPTNAAPGQLVHFHATATDLDGDTLAYAWTADDLDFSTNNLAWFAKGWDLDSRHLVRCVVSDMKGGTASAQVLVTVGTGGGYKVTGRITDTNGLPVEGVQVSNGGTDVFNYFGGVTDSDGNYTVVSLGNQLALTALKYGYTFTNLTWANPLNLTNDQSGIDFTALALPALTLEVDTNTVSEVGGNLRNFVLTRTGDTTTNLSVVINLSGAATPEEDYTLTPALVPGTNLVDFPPGSNQVVFACVPLDDALVEGSEAVTLTVLEDTNYVYVAALPGSATLTITDDDQPARPEVSVFEGKNRIQENGQDRGEFIFTRTGPTTGDLPVNYTVGGTATAGTDYPTLPGVVIIPAGSSTATVRFLPLDDKDVEPDETVTATVTASGNYDAGANNTATVTLVNDDLLTVTIFPTGTDCLETGNAGEFTVQREGDITPALLVNYAVSGTASNGVDYAALSGSVVIPAGQTSVKIPITPLNDALVEGDESVTLTLSNAPPCNVGLPGAATLLIRDDERPVVTITAADATASEPGSDTGWFTISRAPVSSGDLPVNFALSGTAINGVDYIPLDNPVVIPDGQTQVQLEVVPFDDLHVEPDETVLLTLQPGSNYVVAANATAKVTISDDDPLDPPAVGFTTTASGADEHLSPGISVTLSSVTNLAVSVDVRVIGGTASSNDYTLTTNLVIAAGTTVAQLPLAIHDNSILQPNRTVRLVLVNPINATLDGLKFHTYTIIDDDSAQVTLTATVTNAVEGGANGNFRFTRVGNTISNLTVNFQVTGTAGPGADYQPLGTAVTIPAGSNFVDLAVVPVNDAVVELPETVAVTLISAPGAQLVAPHTATVNVLDNDTNGLPVITVSATNRPYAVEGGAAGAFVFTRTGPTTNALTVNYTVAGSASAPSDYAAIGTSVTFPVGVAAVTNLVTAVDDASVEGEETVIVALTAQAAYRVAFPSSATVIVQDNDQIVRVDASDFLAAEPGTDTGSFTFTRTGTTNTPLTVFFTLSGTASNGVDYVNLSNSFTIPAGQFSAVLPVVPLDDLLREGSEYATLSLVGTGAYALGEPTSGTVTIADDEPMLTITATVTNTLEGGQQPGVFTLTRTGDLRYEFTARLEVTGDATYGVDYPRFLTNVSFACGVASIDLQVVAINELLIEPEETVAVRLLPDPAYTILSPSNASLTITDAGSNRAPVVTIIRPSTSKVYIDVDKAGMVLRAAVQDLDGGPISPPKVTWSQEQGADDVIFGNTNKANTTVIFTNAGYYVLRLTADDGLAQTYTEISVFVNADSVFSPDLLYWRFNEGAGTNTVDASRKRHHGALVGNAAWATNGVQGAGLLLSGTNGYVRETSHKKILDGLGAFTVAMWVKCANTNRDQGLLSANDASASPTLGLRALSVSDCGGSGHVFDATIPTTGGTGHYVSAANRLTNGWQHVALTWASGSAPQLYLNGVPDRTNARSAVLSGRLMNCPDFIIGKGPADLANQWGGLVDEVRIYAHALSSGAVGGVSGLPSTGGGGGAGSNGSGTGYAPNFAPIVDAGTNFTIQINTTGSLSGVVIDDDLPDPPATVSNEWSIVSGPDTAYIADPTDLHSAIFFTDATNYVFRLIADDGEVAMFDDVDIHVTLPTRVDLYATDSEAAELGPDLGQFTLLRDGDTNADLTVFLHIGGVASNGVDYPLLTNTLVIPAMTNELRFDLRPYLDHRTEGDESVTLTVLTNIAYTVGNSPATVTIHDSPYGQWTVNHFTLEELTDPSLSGETADYDRDLLGNFVEYSANLDPKSADTNGPNAFSKPFVLTVEPDSGGTNHLTLTYTRRLPPTDVAYNPALTLDLQGWLTGTNYFEEFTNAPDTNGFTETVKTRLVAPYPQKTNQFITIQVELLSTGP